MELKYVVLTIIKILISVPAILMVVEVEGAALMGGHYDNTNSTTNSSLPSYLDDYESYDDSNSTQHSKANSEEVPDPSALVVPGYNLPENIFNKGKPFYLEKDPLTGQIDFTKQAKLDDELYDYVEEEPSGDLYDKANIDRKDGSLGSHRPSDVNQLTPNFHDFLNLPVKYNSDKYVVPLISSSYANTKIQGNVNKYQNHKNYNVKTSTVKPTQSPTYYSSSSTTTVRTTTSTTPKIYLTQPPKQTNFNYRPAHPQFGEEFVEETTPPSSTTTKRTMSLFEQLFGDYEEEVATERTKPPPLFVNLPSNKNKKEGPNTESTPPKMIFNSHAGPDVTTPTNVVSSTREIVTTPLSTTTTTFEYEDYEGEHEDNIAVENRPITTLAPPTTLAPLPNNNNKVVTSLPLGDNHIQGVNNRAPIIVATQNLKEKLNSEVVPSHGKPFGFDKPPSTSNVHIAPDQDTVSFVVGNHQSVDGGQYVGTSLKESPYESNPFRPLYGQQEHKVAPGNQKVTFSSAPDTQKVSYSAPTNQKVSFSAPANQKVSFSDQVTIQPLKTSEASLSIGVPVSNQKPGQVVDEELPEGDVDYPKGTGTKIVFPEDEKTIPLAPPPEVFQLASDLTPPQVVPVSNSRIDRPRPPWDPRPGHFFSGKPEYVRPPRPPPEVAFKRIDNLPNILPQFRPNMNVVNNNKRLRQPLMDRPSNRPIAFFEKLQPPPTFQHLRREDPEGEGQAKPEEQFGMFRVPPNVPIANRRVSDDDVEVETLQMIQAKHLEKKEVVQAVTANGTDKPLYVVYPVNSPPLKLDVIEANKESVVIGTRAELPLPPSKIANNKDLYDNPLLIPPNVRKDAPILKPHPKPPTFPIKSDFPYPLERPDPSVIHPAVPETPSNTLDNSPKYDDLAIMSSNQWNTIGEALEPRIVNHHHAPSNQISATLKTYTEKPIAVAYTPTEPHDKFSLPNYGSPVIPEIRDPNEITVSAVMHTQPQISAKIDTPPQPIKAELDFQAPFQASVSVEHPSEGWSVVRDKNKTTTEGVEVTTMPLATTSEFDIENFKPQLIGGFKPIYNYPEDGEGKAQVNEREE